MTKRCLDPALLHAHPAAPDPDGCDGLHLHHPRRRRREVHLRQEVGHMEPEKGLNIFFSFYTHFLTTIGYHSYIFVAGSPLFNILVVYGIMFLIDF